jgi:hypothetical protein
MVYSSTTILWKSDPNIRLRLRLPARQQPLDQTEHAVGALLLLLALTWLLLVTATVAAIMLRLVRRLGRQALLIVTGTRHAP